MEVVDGQIVKLIADLGCSDKPTIRAAVDALIPLAKDSYQLRAKLDVRLAATEQSNCWPIAYVLGHLTDPSGACISALIEALNHREPDIRWAVALLLVRIAKERSAVLELLTDLCAKGTASQKRMALYCVRDLQLSDPASLAALQAALGDADATVRVAAAICLKQRPELDEEGKSVLLDIYASDVDPRVRHAAAITLASLGTPSDGFLDILTQRSDSEDNQTQKAALAALELLKKTRSASDSRQSDC